MKEAMLTGVNSLAFYLCHQKFISIYLKAFSAAF